MEFRLDDGQLELQQTLARYCADRFPLDAAVSREGQAVDREAWREMADLGMFSVLLPEGGLGAVEAILLFEHAGDIDALVVGHEDSVVLHRTADLRPPVLLEPLDPLTPVGRFDALAEGEPVAAAEAGIGKLSQTRIVKLAASLGVGILGAGGMLASPGAEEDGAYSEALVFSPASSIYGGTDQIQRNIVAERTLGLPRDPAPDRGRPFREVLTGRSGGGRANEVVR